MGMGLMGMDLMRCSARIYISRESHLNNNSNTNAEDYLQISITMMSFDLKIYFHSTVLRAPSCLFTNDPPLLGS